MIKNNISIITQENLMFDRTIRENIELGESFTHDQLMEAIDHSQLSSLIANKDNGYDFAVGNKGRYLSGGQKQRINIARVCIRDPSIVICDEGSSALDVHNEKLIMDNILNIFKDKTILFITHKLSFTLGWDMVIVMDKGHLVEAGNPQQLLMDKGMYWAMMEEYQKNS